MRIGIYAAGADRIPEYADAGVTHIGPYYGTGNAREDILQLCDEYGLKFVYNPWFADTLWEDHTKENLTEILNGVPDQAIIDDALAAVQFATDNADVVDEIYCPLEELRYWRPSEVRFLDLYRGIVDESPFKFWMYEPGHRTASMLTQTPTDYVAMGCYTVNDPERLARSTKQFNQIVQAASVLGNTPVAILQLFVDYTSHDHSYIALEFWRAIAEGVRGFQVFSGWEGRPGLQTFDEQIEVYLRQFQLVNGPENLGDVIENSDQVGSLVASQQSQLLSHTDHKGEEWLFPGLGHATFKKNGQRFLLLVNSSEEPAQVELTEQVNFEDLFSSRSVNSNQIAVPALSVTFLREVPVPEYNSENVPREDTVVQIISSGYSYIGTVEAVEDEFVAVSGVPYYYRHIDAINEATFTPVEIS